MVVCLDVFIRGWGGSSFGKTLTVEIWDPSSNSRTQVEKPDTVVCACNFSSRKMEIGGSLDLAGQSTY